jgi:hypothetical protein
MAVHQGREQDKGISTEFSNVVGLQIRFPKREQNIGEDTWPDYPVTNIHFRDGTTQTSALPVSEITSRISDAFAQEGDDISKVRVNISYKGNGQQYIFKGSLARFFNDREQVQKEFNSGKKGWFTGCIYTTEPYNAEYKRIIFRGEDRRTCKDFLNYTR